MRLSEKLVFLRVSKRMTQLDLSETFGISRNTLCGYELGTRKPNVIVLKKYADYFKVSADWLLGRDSSKDVNPREDELISSEEIKRLEKIARLKQEIAELQKEGQR